MPPLGPRSSGVAAAPTPGQRRLDRPPRSIARSSDGGLRAGPRSDGRSRMARRCAGLLGRGGSQQHLKLVRGQSCKFSHLAADQCAQDRRRDLVRVRAHSRDERCTTLRGVRRVLDGEFGQQVLGQWRGAVDRPLQCHLPWPRTKSSGSCRPEKQRLTPLAVRQHGSVFSGARRGGLASSGIAVETEDGGSARRKDFCAWTGVVDVPAWQRRARCRAAPAPRRPCSPPRGAAGIADRVSCGINA